MLIVGVVVASVGLMLARPRGVAEAWWVCGGAFVLVATRGISLAAAGRAVAKGLDVYAFLAGMMLLAEVARATGVFDWVAAHAVRRAKDAGALFGLVYGVGVAVTTFLSNDATAVVLTPAILVAVKKAKVEPLPHLYVCALVANAASFVLPISNPANLVLFQHGMPSLGRWLAMFALPSIASIGVTYGALRLFFRRELASTIQAEVPATSLPAEGRPVVIGLALTVAALLVTSALHRELGLPTLACAIAVALASRRPPVALARKISVSTLLLVAGLFVFVEAIEGIGAIGATTAGVAYLARVPSPVGTLAAALGVGVTNNVVNNLPLGLLTGATIAAGQPPPTLVKALLLGVDLGPNLAITGSLATILWRLALREAEIAVGFWDFLKVGAIAMPPALIAATLAALV